jgi:hypothetical protein
MNHDISVQLEQIQASLNETCTEMIQVRRKRQESITQPKMKRGMRFMIAFLKNISENQINVSKGE